MVEAYWEVGRRIVEEEQAGRERADYGKRVIAGLSDRLREEFGKGYDRSNLFHMRAFFLAYPIVDAVRRQLSWTHYRLLLRVDKSNARAFYETEAINARWSTRELERQINSLLFDRLALSRDKAGVLALAQKGHEITQPSDLVKDPLVLEFTGLRQDEHFLESDLEQALLGKLQQFLLELGKGFAFMGRQQRITLDGRHFFIDLVFYNRAWFRLRVSRVTWAGGQRNVAFRSAKVFSRSERRQTDPAGVDPSHTELEPLLEPCLQPDHTIVRSPGPQSGNVDAPGSGPDADVRQLLPT